MSFALSDLDKGWVIGMLEGEGSFVLNCGRLRIELRSIDEDTIDKLVTLLPESRKSGPYGPYNDIGKQPQFYWSLNKMILVDDLVDQIFDYLSRRRQQQITKVLHVVQ